MTETAHTADPHDLERFVNAQRDAYPSARDELARGRKTSHWMWFVFPQSRGLGRSPMARHYGIASRDEAAAYLRHPILGPRLVECVQRLLALERRSAHEVFGSPDDIKLRSSLTLFDAVSPPGNVFAEGLARYFGGQRDDATLQLIA